MSSSTPRPSHICHVITGLNTGGAETALYRLLQGIDRERFDLSVVSLTDTGTYGERITSLGIPVACLNMQAGKLPLRGIVALRNHLNRTRPDVIQCWMYHANLLSSLAGWLSRNPVPIVWNIRHSIHDLREETRKTRWVIRAGGLLSSRPAGIVYNSQQAQQQHQALGYQSSSALCIPNGFDLSNQSDDDSLRTKLRRSLGIPLNVPVIGHVGRYHRMKGHATFLKAVAPLQRSFPDAHFVMCGNEITVHNSELGELIAELGLSQVHLLGERNDVPQLMTAMDTLCSSSLFGEGFPNVIGEAMAAGLPCVATDVGDSARIIDKTGFVVPPGDAHALAEALSTLLQLDESQRLKLGAEARQRIEQHYSLESMVDAYERLYQSVMETN